jgi:hypothetical protein
MVLRGLKVTQVAFLGGSETPLRRGRSSPASCETPVYRPAIAEVLARALVHQKSGLGQTVASW